VSSRALARRYCELFFWRQLAQRLVRGGTSHRFGLGTSESRDRRTTMCVLAVMHDSYVAVLLSACVRERCLAVLIHQLHGQANVRTDTSTQMTITEYTEL
jgi:hypothetical protein